MPLKQTYLNLVQLTTKNAVGATLVMILALTAVSTSAAQLLAPEDYKPTTVLGLNKVETRDSNSSPESQVNQTDGEAKEEQKEGGQNNTPIADQDQKIILELERELGIQIPKVSKEQWNARFVFTAYTTNPQQKVIRLRISSSYSSKNKIKNEHLQLITELTSLEWLRLGNTQITKIKGLEKLTNLQELSLDSNQITKIEGLDNLTNLQVLSLDRNQITKIEGLDNLTSLRWFWLQGNQITGATPLEALLLNQKKAGKPVLDISSSLGGNPLQTPPMEVVKEGTEAFLEWIEENK